MRSLDMDHEQSSPRKNKDQFFSADYDEEANVLVSSDVADDIELQSQIQANNINNMLFDKNQAIKSSSTKWNAKLRVESKLTNQKIDNNKIESANNVQDQNDLYDLNNIFVGDSITNLVEKEPIVLNTDIIFNSPTNEFSSPEINNASSVRTTTSTFTAFFSILIKQVQSTYDDEEILIDDMYYEEELQHSIENIAKKVINDYLQNPLVTPHITTFENACSTKTITQNITTTLNVTHTLTANLSNSIISSTSTFTASDVFSTLEKSVVQPIQLKPKIPINLTEFNRSISKDVKDFDHVNTLNSKNLEASSSRANSLPVNLEDLLSSRPVEQSEEIKVKKTGVSGWIHDVKSFFSKKHDDNKYKLSEVNKKDNFVNYFGKRSLILGEEDLNEYTNNDYTLQIYNRYNSMMGAVVAVLAVVLFV
ncbi:hypothetical protein ACO0OL_001543 [Hanseniaspora opuntiae]